MAHMIPDTLLEEDFDPASQEDKVFERLKALPDDYTVFHSIWISSSKEQEIDFLIFHKEKGILCLESKAGQVAYRSKRWYYGNGKEMKHGGPYNQVRGAMYALLDKLHDYEKKHENDSCRNGLSNRCLFQYGVCFPSITRQQFNKIRIPNDANPARTLTDDDLHESKIKQAIDSVFAVENADFGPSRSLDNKGANVLIYEFLCPTFDIVPSPNVERADRERHFLKLLKEQARVLDFLVDQRSAAICGAAGTGKTLVALEKAKQEARNGDQVLFLCFNSFLRDHLKEICKKERCSGTIDVKTIAEYACSVCHTGESDYGRLIRELDTMFDDKAFPYDHVIVDEAQDFGSLGDYQTYDVLESLEMCIRQNETGTFFLFYDRLQMIQAKQLPSVIENAD